MPRMKEPGVSLKQLRMTPEERGQDALIRYIDSRTGRHQEYTQARLAEKIGISPSAMSDRMTKKYQFRHNEILRIIRVLNATDAEILSFFGREPGKSRGMA